MNSSSKQQTFSFISSAVPPEHEQFEEETPTAIDLASSHKKVFLRFIKAEKQFLKNPEKYPKYLEIMTADLNKLDYVLNSSEWIEILNAWTQHTQIAYQTFIRTNNDSSSLTDEDEELIQQIQENKLWTEPSTEQINCILNQLGAAKTISDKLWATISSELERLGGPKKTAIFWKRVFQRIQKRTKAKKELFIHITKHHPHVDKKYRSLSNIELRILKIPIFDQNTHQYTNTGPLQEPKKQLENLLSHCRICLASTSSKMTYLFSERQTSNDENLSILDKLNYCSCMLTKPRIDDGLPQFICMSCSVLLESAYQLKVLCLKTEESLLSLANDTGQVKSESNFCNTSDSRAVEMESDSELIKEEYCVEESNESDNEETEDSQEIIVRVVGDKEDYSERDNEVVETVVVETVENNAIATISMEADEVDESDENEDETMETANESKSSKIATKSKVHQNNKMAKSGGHKCNSCSRTFSNATGLKIHNKSHGITKPHQCTICNKIFKTSGVLTIHMRSHTGERPYVCEVCGKSFMQKSSFVYHTAVHTNTKNFHCTLCPYKSVDANGLRIHSRSHSGERPYQCDYCSANFKTCSNLRKHIRCKHKDEKSYKTCGKSFKTISAINDHRAIHSELREFECLLCPYKASTKANLKIHDRTHSGVRPYKCHFCSLKFSTAGNMNKHMRNIHHKMKTHKCDQCDRSFFTRDSARKHMVTHTGLKPYTCPECPMAYSWYNGLRKHVKHIHANIKIPTETSFFNRLKDKTET